MTRAGALSNGFIVDRYTVQARIRPALIALLPAMITVALWYPAVWSIWRGLTALLTTCGVLALLGEIARQRGKKVERRMIAKNGGKFTTIFLRHSDSTLSASTKAVYHEYLTARSGRQLPNVRQEVMDPRDADDAYRGAVDWLLAATRDRSLFPLVFEENISYGFCRNLLGLKAFAGCVLVTSFAMTVYLTLSSFPGDKVRFQVGCVEGGVLLLGAVLWFLVVNMELVEEAGRSYALRLLAQIDTCRGKKPEKMPASAPSGRSKTMKQSEPSV